LKKLNPDRKALLDSDKICLKDTRVEIIQKISQWIHSTKTNVPQTFFLYGTAGTGKSAIAHTIGNKCREEDCLGSFFHFDKTFSMEQTPSKAIKSIAFNLAMYVPEFGAGLVEILDKDPYVLISPSLKEQWQSLILKPAQLVPQSRPVVIIIDALDECGPHIDGDPRMKFFSILMDGIHELPHNFRVLVTSRLENDVTEILDRYANQFYIQNMSELRNTKHDIYKYVIYRMEQSIRQGIFNLDQCQILAERAEEHFQWAHTVCEALHHKVRLGMKVKQRFEKFMAFQDTKFNPLDHLYKSILEEILDVKDDNVMKEYRKVIAQILAASEPLSKSTLQRLQIAYSHYKGEKNGEEGVEAIIPWFGSLLTGINEWDVPIRPVHTSIRDFLLDKSRSGDFAIDLVEGHKIMAAGSIILMTEQLHFNMCNLPSSYLQNYKVDKLADRISFGILPEMSYACCFWDVHLVHFRCNKQMLAIIKRFLFTSSIFWMEALSILNRINVISRSMENVLESMKDRLRLQGMATEIKQFIYIFGKMMTESTPHLYVSALPFLPANSMLRNAFLGYFQNLTTVCKGHKEHWPSIQAILQGHTGYVNAVTFSPDGKTIASGSDDFSIRLWDAETGNAVGKPLCGHTHYVNAVAFSPDGKKIISGSSDYSVRIWNAETGQGIGRPLYGHTHYVRSVAFSPDGKKIVSGSFDCSLRIWDAETGNAAGRPLLGHTGYVRSVAFSPNGERIVSGSHDCSIRIWDAEAGSIIGRPLQGHTHYVRSVAFSADGRRIVSASDDRSVRIWDAQTQNAVGKPLWGHTHFVNSVSISADGRKIASASDDCSVRVWDTETGTRVVSGSDDNSVRIWDAETGNALGKPLQGHTDYIRSVTFSPDGKKIASGSNDYSVRVWDAETGTAIGSPLQGHTDYVTSVAFSPDGHQIVSGSSDCSLLIWDIDTGKAVSKALQGHTHYVRSVAFSPDGTRILSGSDDCSIRIWNAKTGNIIGRPLQGHTHFVNSVAFSPDGQRIVSGSFDHSIRIWDAETGTAIGKSLQGHEDYVTTASFSSDGKRIISGSADCTLRIWDAESGNAIGEPLQGHTNYISSVAISPDGKRIVSSSNDCSYHSYQPFHNILLHNDGWIRGSDASLLLWIPPEYRTEVAVPPLRLFISNVPQVSLDLSHFAHGTHWTDCFRGFCPTSSSSLLMSDNEYIDSMQPPPRLFKQMKNKFTELKQIVSKVTYAILTFLSNI
ncbi:hypothetical protein GYMLUDRAFT_1012462, partial [Collybiopsis luxurians FD-317 M1]